MHSIRLAKVGAMCGIPLSVPSLITRLAVFLHGNSLLAASTISMLSIWVIHGYYMLLVVMNDADQQYIHHYLGD